MRHNENTENEKGNTVEITIGSEKQIDWANDIKASFIEGAKLDLAKREVHNQHGGLNLIMKMKRGF